MVKAQKIQETQSLHANVEEGPTLHFSKSVEGTKLLYILVQDDPVPGAEDGEQAPSHRYTRPMLSSTLQLMGCKPRHAIKISDRVFEVIRSQMPLKQSKRDRFVGLAPLADMERKETKELNTSELKADPKPLKKRSTFTVSREKFLDVVCEGLAQHQYLGPKQRIDLMVACRIRERRTSVTVLLCGTSGCGKSTLASLLGHRLGVTTVVSTDSVRHMMRGFVSEEENPLLWSSTYHAGEFLDPEAVSEAIQKKKGHMRTPSTGSSTPVDSGCVTEIDSKPAVSNGNDTCNYGSQLRLNGDCPNVDIKGKGITTEDGPCLRPSGSGKLENAECLVSAKVMAVQGFKAQSEMVMDSLDRLITGWEKRRESVVVEGVHLSLNFVMGLMRKHPSIIPFMVYIANESKHMERFAVRAKYMTLDPSKNKYVKYIRNIRTIQDYLCKRADKHLVPKINNTNVDKSVAAIHATVFNCLRRMDDGDMLLDLNTNTVKVVHQEYSKQYTASALGSKSMFQLIQRQGSSRNLLAIMNDDGSVNKAWPVESEKKPEASVFEHKVVGSTLYGPLSVGSAEPVRLQFGNLGLSAWKSDNGTSSEDSGPGAAPHGGEDSVDDGDPRHAPAGSSGIGTDKELKEDIEVDGSDEELEEVDETAVKEGETSESELERVEDNEMEGSVDDDSGRSEGEGEDDIIAREEDDAYWEVEESSPLPKSSPAIVVKDKKAHMLRLRSFDKAAAGRTAPVLRRSNSHKLRSSSIKHSPKRLSPKSVIQAAFASKFP